MMINFKKFNESFKDTYIPKKKPLRESKETKPLSEGAGAGYTIEGNIDDAVVREILSVSKDEDNVFTYKIDSFASLKDIKAYSYYYGDELPEADIRVSSISLVFYDEEGNSDKNPAVLPENLEYIINHLKLKATIGAGWSHKTFDGIIEASNGDLDKPESDYDYDVMGLHITFDDDSVIQYIDDAVTGELEMDEEENNALDEGVRRTLIGCDVAKARVNKLYPPVKGPKYAEVQTYKFKMDADLILTDVAPPRSKYYAFLDFGHIGNIPVKVTSVTLNILAPGGADFPPRELTPDNFEHILGNLMLTIPLPSEGHTETHIEEGQIKYQGLQLIADLPFHFYIYSITLDFLDRGAITKFNKGASEELASEDFVESCGAMSDYLKESLERKKNNVSE